MKNKWNLKLVGDFSSTGSHEGEIKKMKEVTDSFVDKWKENTDYLSDPKVLAEALLEYENWIETCRYGGSLGYYSWLRNQVDGDDGEVKSLYTKLESLSTELSNRVQFFEMRLSKVDESTQAKLLSSEELSDVKNWLERTFAEAKHLLTEKEEKIMSLKSSASYERWVQMLENRLSQESAEVITKDGKKEKTFNDIMGSLSDKDKKIRDSAATAVHSILDKYAPIAEAEINAVLHDKKINDELRGFERPDSSRHLSDNFDSVVVDSMRKVVRDNFDISNKYYQFKAKMLGQDKLEYHERNVPIGALPDDFNFEDSTKLVSEVFYNLHERFGKTLDEYLKNGNIDVFPKKGKRGGAFCVYWTPKHPVFVMLNHTDKLTDVTTLAHELGHALNDELMRDKQRTLNFETSTGTAEVASTFMEDFVLEKLLESASDEERLAIMMKRLDDDISSICRQVACYEFEAELHEKVREEGYLPKEKIGELFKKNMSAYMGSGVEQSAGSDNWWVYWSHIRRFFYVYSYASGLLISKSMQAFVREDKKNIDKVIEFLETGAKKSPKDTFLSMGIDITDEKFWEKGMESIRDQFESVKELAKKLGKV